MGKLSITVAAVFLATFTAAASAQARQRSVPGDEGFFRPAADPALTSIRPPAADGKAAPRQPATAVAPPAATAAVEAAEEIRKAEEAQMDRVLVEHAIVTTGVVPKAPAITSPLDGTAPILSPLDGTAPILSPVGR